MTPTRPRPRPSPPRWGLAVFVGAVLMGLLGMHALAMSCGTVQPTPSSSSAVASVAAPDVHRPAAHATGTSGGTSHGTAEDHDEHGSDQMAAGGSMSSALMSVCVGLLVSALVLLAAVLSILMHRGWKVPALRLTDARWALPLTRQRPPALTLSTLCLLRC